MQFLKDGNIYKIARITGSQDDILGVSFSDEATEIEVIEWEVKPGAKIKSSSIQVLQQVEIGLNEINQILDKSYFLSKIYYLPSDSSSNAVYHLLIQELVKRIDHDEELHH